MRIIFCLISIISVSASGSSPFFTMGDFPSLLTGKLCSGQDPFYYITLATTSFALDLKDGYLPAGGRIQLWEYWGGANQIFRAVNIGNDLYIQSLTNSLCAVSTIPLTLQTCNTLDLGQRWEINGSNGGKGVGKIRNGSLCLNYGHFNTTNRQFYPLPTPAENGLDVSLASCDNAPLWRWYSLTNNGNENK